MVSLPEFVTIPAVPFRMGTPEAELSGLAKAYGGTRESYREETPQHTVTLAAFALAKTTATNALYAAFVAASGAAAPSHWRGSVPPEALLQHPVVNVSWAEARVFCDWLSANAADRRVYRLPSEAEWERAARGSAGRAFPWGDQWDGARANTSESGFGPLPVGGYLAGASQEGCLELAGGVWEWTSSLDHGYPYRPADGREDSQAAGRRILRGGCYANPHGFARCACRFRLPPAVRNEFIGVRLAYSPQIAERRDRSADDADEAD